MNDRSKDYVFVSYSHKDNIHDFLSFFEELGYNLVYDESLSFGEEWDLNVRRFVNNNLCKGILCILSEHSIVSRPVLQELDYARIYNKKVFAISKSNCSVKDLITNVTNDTERVISTFIGDHFPPNKLYLNACDLNKSIPQIRNTFEEWGLLPQKDDFGPESAIKLDRYQRNLPGEENRAEIQQQGYVDFDKGILEEVFSKYDRPLVILDVGSSNGDVTYSRFNSFEKIEKVIGFDYNQSDVDEAKAKYGSDPRFSFYCLDADSDSIVDSIRHILNENGLESIDIVFSALTLHHLKSPSIFLLRLYELFSEDGSIIIRESDDGGKYCFPEGEMLTELLTRYNSITKTASDRYFGRKMYNLLYNAGYVNIEMRYRQQDTCEKSRSHKEFMYEIGFGFRVRRLEKMEKDNIGNKALLDEIAWQKNALNQLHKLFIQRDFLYVNTTFVAIAGVK